MISSKHSFVYQFHLLSIIYYLNYDVSCYFKINPDKNLSGLIISEHEVEDDFGQLDYLYYCSIEMLAAAGNKEATKVDEIVDSIAGADGNIDTTSFVAVVDAAIVAIKVITNYIMLWQLELVEQFHF